MFEKKREEGTPARREACPLPRSQGQYGNNLLEETLVRPG